MELLGKCADELSGAQGNTLKSAYEKIEEQEDEHLYHTERLVPGAVDAVARARRGAASP